jgi:hypothetical protein
VLPAEQYLKDGPKLGALHTLEDVKRHIAARVTSTAGVHASLLRRRQLVRRTAMIVGLFCSSSQYYFFTISLEILSMPSLTVFLPVVRVG